MVQKGILTAVICCFFVTLFAQAVPSSEGKIPGNSWGAWTQIKKLRY